MKTLERSQKLLAQLKKRVQTPDLLVRIARVEAEIKELSLPKAPVLPAAAEKPIEKKKRKVIKEIEVDVDEDET